MAQQELFGAEPKIYTVTTLTAAIHRVLSAHFDDVRVMGEISGYKLWTSGHAYFTLKDNGAQIRCVLFRQVLRYLKFTPGDGMAVVARGAVEVRQERGEYQLIVTSLEPQGAGARCRRIRGGSGL
jgi:exodeoxyribonuclease VII large subunit